MQGIDVAASLRHPARPMLTPDIIWSSIAISLFPLFSISLVAFGPACCQVTSGFSQPTASTVLIWAWAVNAGGLVLCGPLSDKTAVRKPFMLAGPVVSAICIIIFLSRATHPHTSYGTFAVILAVTMFFAGLAYVAWMASCTETAERRNPALTAAGLAIWGLIIRVSFAVFIFIVPVIAGSVTTIAEHGPAVQQIAAGQDLHLTAAQSATVTAVAKDPAIRPRVQALAAKYAPELTTAAAACPATQAALAAHPADTAAAVQAAGEIAAGLRIPGPAATARLVAPGNAPKAGLAFLARYGKPLQDPQVPASLKYLHASAPTVTQAVRDGPGQWQACYWIAAGGAIVFMLHGGAQDKKVMTCRRVAGPVPDHAPGSCWVHSPRCRPRPSSQARNAIAAVRRCLARWQGRGRVASR